jgi:hypothetical protein
MMTTKRSHTNNGPTMDDYEMITSGKTATLKTKLVTTTKRSRTYNGRTMDDLFDTKIF